MRKVDAAASTGSLDAAVRTAAAALSGARTAVVCGHVDPDGDALGSALAISTALRALGVDVHTTWGSREPGQPPAPLDPALDFLTGAKAVLHPDDVHPVPDVVVSCDTGAASRLGTLRPVLGRAGTVIVIDHHDVGAPFGDVRVVDPSASSTGVLALRLIDALGVALTPAIADALYLAVLTDTGRFSFASTTADDHRVAARLMEAGADHVRVARAVYESASPGYLALVHAVTGRVRMDDGLVWAFTTRADLEYTGAIEQDVEGLIDLLRRVDEPGVTLFLRETPAGRWRCSLRSQGRDVAIVAREFGGGGHQLAAGFSADGDPAVVAERVAAVMREADGETA